MSVPNLRRDGDVFVFTWRDEDVAIGLEHFSESRDGLHAEITVESGQPGFSGHVHGPVRLNLLSTESQNRLAKVLGERINQVDWQRMLVEACALVTAEWRRPTPVVDLSQGADPGPVDMLLPGMPRGENVGLYGDGQGGKSLVALLLGLGATRGVVLPWAASVREAPLTVMYLDWETNERTVRSRLRRICRGYGLEDVPRLLYREMTRPLVDVVDVLRADRTRLGIDLFIFDSLSFAVTGSLNDDDVARGGMNAMRSLAPATRIFTAHVNQATATASVGTARPFGSAFFWNGMRSGWEIRRADDTPQGVIDLGLYHRKANDGQLERPAGVHVEFDGLDGPIRFSRGDLDDSPDLISRTTMSMRIRAALRGGRLDTNELAEQLETNTDTVSKTARRMADVIQLEQGGGRGKPAVWGLSE